jgi:hypothetical protein
MLETFRAAGKQLTEKMAEKVDKLGKNGINRGFQQLRALMKDPNGR